MTKFSAFLIFTENKTATNKIPPLFVYRRKRFRSISVWIVDHHRRLINEHRFAGKHVVVVATREKKTTFLFSFNNLIFKCQTFCFFCFHIIRWISLCVFSSHNFCPLFGSHSRMPIVLNRQTREKRIKKRRNTLPVEWFKRRKSVLLFTWKEQRK